MSHSKTRCLTQEMKDSLVQEFEGLSTELFSLAFDVDDRLMAVSSRLDRLQDVIRTGEYPQNPEGGLETL